MPKRGVTFIKPEEPKFLKRMKEQMGYQEPDTIETKRQALPVDKEDGEEHDDEKPVIVTLKPGDLTEDEFEKEIAAKDDANESNKRMLFSKPVKRVTDDNRLSISSKRAKDDLKKRVKSQNEKAKQVKNTSLLSFDDDEYEEG